MRVAICDDARVVRQSLGAFLSKRPEISEVLELETPEETIRAARSGLDALILDLRLHGDESGIDVLEALNHLSLEIPVLAISASEDPSLALSAIAWGASGFCGKNEPAPVLLERLLQVASGAAAIPPELWQPIVRGLAGRGPTREGRLTPRERQILELLSRGMRRNQIAAVLQVSPNTVRTHLQHSMRKLDVDSELAAAARMRAMDQAK